MPPPFVPVTLQEAERENLVREILESPNLGAVLQDPYGNYVVQSALSVTSGSTHTALVESIKPFMMTLRGTPHGKRILAKIGIKV